MEPKKMALLGIASAVFSLVTLPIVFGPIAIFLGYKAKKEGEETLGMIAIILGIILSLISMFIGMAFEIMRQGNEYEKNQLITSAELTETYSDYGISFMYPEGMLFESQPWLGIFADDESGIIFGEYYPNDEVYNIIKISWMKVDPIRNEADKRELLEIGIEVGYDLISGIIENSNEFERGELSEAEFNGIEVLYEEYFADLSDPENPDMKLYGVLGSFYCESNEKSFTFNSAYSKEEDAMDIFSRYVESFVCDA